MKKLLDLITKETEAAFSAAGYDPSYGKVTLSNRPDLCEYQCNGALAAAKVYKKAPLMIAEDVAGQLLQNNIIAKAAAVPPGFINLNINPAFLAEYLKEMRVSPKFGLEEPKVKKKIIIDYGGPNVAKPLHVGHLRSAIIGESIKRIARYVGHQVIGDIHLGDWGLQMGLIITELKRRNQKLPYFNPEHQGAYPKEAPFTIGELEEIYPAASARSKEDAPYKEEAMAATYLLQQGDPGYRALWKHILEVSVADLRKNYDSLNVTFDLWNGESDVQDLIPAMVQEMKDGGYAYESDGALVVDVKRESDTKEIPPCMILKSDGASLYNTTDLATIKMRRETDHPDEIIYVVDKRQELYFEQVFRCALKTGLADQDTVFKFIGFGTMNGKDGKPFKTREGGVMRLEDLIRSINEEMYRKIVENKNSTDLGDAKETARIVALSALKYGDLSNQAAKDYVFDMERFLSFEGDTGPYILYTIVRIKSILAKYEEEGGRMGDLEILPPGSEAEKTLMMEAAKFNAVIENAYQETAPHKICAYVYDMADTFNHFYHETKILTEADKSRKESFIGLLSLVRDLMESCIELLGFYAPERM